MAETVYVLESFYEASRDEVADAVRSLVVFGSIVCVDPALLLRAIEVYETDRIDFAEAYLVACAESTGVGKVASFDRSIGRVRTIERIEPPRSDSRRQAAAYSPRSIADEPRVGQACVESSRGRGGSRWNVTRCPPGHFLQTKSDAERTTTSNT